MPSSCGVAPVSDDKACMVGLVHRFKQLCVSRSSSRLSFVTQSGRKYSSVPQL